MPRTKFKVIRAILKILISIAVSVTGRSVLIAIFIIIIPIIHISMISKYNFICSHSFLKYAKNVAIVRTNIVNPKKVLFQVNK